MERITESHLVGECSGWDGETKFELDNGQTWEQSVYRYRYFYRYRPKVRVWKDGGHFLLEVEGVSEMLPVRRC